MVYRHAGSFAVCVQGGGHDQAHGALPVATLSVSGDMIIHALSVCSGPTNSSCPAEGVELTLQPCI